MPRSSRRWLKSLPLALLLLAGCKQTATAAGGGGQSGSSALPGLMLDFGGAEQRDCPTPDAGAANGDGGATGTCAGAARVDYATEVAPILAGCHGEVCHDFSQPSGIEAFIGTPADECCNQRELIAPGHPEQSYLLDKLAGKKLCYGARMPLNLPPLADADLRTLHDWICGGALLP
jgi:hypothetical protein